MPVNRVQHEVLLLNIETDAEFNGKYKKFEIDL